MKTKIKRLADRLALDVLERSDDPILIEQAEDLQDYIRKMPIKRENAIEEASEHFEFEGMRYNKDGDELNTAEQVEKKAVKFLKDRGFTIIN